MTRVGVVVALFIGMLVANAPLAAAESGHTVSGRGDSVINRAWMNGQRQASSGRGSASRAAEGSSSAPRKDKAQARQVALVKKQAATIQTAYLNYSACMNSMQSAIDHGMAPTCKLSFAAASKAPSAKPKAGVTKAVAAAVSPIDIAYIAVARLTLTPPKPGIGPAPSVNEWKMAAVGYPLWLWAEGNTRPAPVSDSVAGLSVSLRAHLTTVVFAMGDGHSVTCLNAGTRWTRAVVAGAKSPTCGYTYQRPSLPKGSFTVTAQTHWSIEWIVNGERGTIPFVQSASSTLPVGELQVLIR